MTMTNRVYSARSMASLTIAILLCGIVSWNGFADGKEKPEVALRYLLSGQEFIRNGSIEEGIRDLRTVVSSFPGSPEASKALYHIASYYLQIHDRESASKTLDELIEKFPGSAEAAYSNVDMGILLLETLKQADRDAAKAKFERVLNVFPNSKVSDAARVGLARIQIRDGELEAAEAILTQVMIHLNHGVSLTDALRLYAQVKIMQGQPIPAMMALQRAKSISKDTTLIAEIETALNLLIRLYIQTSHELTPDPTFHIVNDEMKSPVDMILAEDGKLLVLDKSDQLFTIDTIKASVLSKTETVKSASRLNYGYLRNTLVTGEETVFENLAPKKFTGYEELKKIVDVTWTTPGEYWVLDRNARCVLRYDGKTQFLEESGKLSIKGDETILACPHGGTWILNPASQRIIFHKANGVDFTELKYEGPGYKMREPVDMTTDQFGHLYVLDESAKQIYIFNHMMKNIRTFSLNAPNMKFKSPVSLTTDTNGSIYVADKKTHTIYRFH